MPIINPGDFPIDPAIVDGTELAAGLNRVMDALASDHSNSTRPPYVVAGGVWTQITPTGGFDLMMFDGTKDYKIGGIKSGQASFGGFDPGTVMLFKQSTPPVGWTKITSDNDAAIRIVSGSVGTGGSQGFTTAFASHTPSGSVSGSVAGHTLTVTEIPRHTHTHRWDGSLFGSGFFGDYAGGGGNQCSTPGFHGAERASGSGGLAIEMSGGDGSHSHGWSGSFSGNAIDLSVKYVDVIAASKD